YLRDINDFAAMNEVYATFFTAPFPARTTIQAGALPGGIAVEIECIARKARVDALDLDTPALYVDRDALERNIARMQEQCRAWGAELRPHVKYAGSKTLSSDQTVGSGTFGHFVGRPWTMRKLNEEHGYVEIHGPGWAHVGEKV